MWEAFLMAITSTSERPRGPGIATPWAFLPDSVLAIGCYLLAYRLRFPDSRFELFVSGALTSLWLVVGCQMLALLVARVHVPGGRFRLISRLLVAAVAGTAVAATVTGVLIGFEGLSRIAFLVDLVLFAIAAIGWRSVYMLVAYMRRPDATAVIEGELVDRAVEMTSFSATFLSVVRYRELLRNLVAKDLKLKYRGSVLGFLWSLVNPLVMIVVYTFAFTYILGIRTEGFVFLVLLGILAWTFFVNAATMSTGSIADSGGLVKSVFFPRAILPTATVLFNLAQYLLTVLVFLPLMLAWYRIPPSLPMLLYPVFLALQVVFVIGVAMILSTATAFFRDVRHLLEIALAVMFWTTPIIYDLSILPERLRLPILLSPMSPYVVAYQKVFYYGEWPDAVLWFLAMTYALAALLIGVSFFVTFQDRFAEQV